MRKSSGFTLLELLIASIMVGVLTLALAQAFGLAVVFPSRAEESRSREAQRIAFESRIRGFVESALVTSTATDTATYFLAGTDAAGDADRLTFTTEMPSISGRVSASADDFETQNQQWGPQGGLEEVSLGLTPVGQAPASEGAFLREQRPADGDATQGGTETLLDPNVTDLQWEFFDGLNWLTDWDSRTVQRRIPSLVRLTYYLQGEDDPHVLVIRLLRSDVTPDNPVVQTAGATP